MNVFYDKRAAAESIGILLHETLEGGDDTNRLQLNNVQTVSYQVCPVAEPRSYRVTLKDDDDFFESTFKIRGVMCQNNLPPIINPMSWKIPGHRLRQSVTLTALGNHVVFENYLSMIRKFADLFHSTFPHEKFAIDAFQKYEGHPCIVAFNRYLSFRSDTPNTPQIPFGREVDPHNILNNHPYQNMHHVEDNEVSYSTRIVVDGKEKLIRANPDIFKNGDLVEVQFSFVAFPMKPNEPRRIGCIMNHLILLSDHLRRESEGRITLAPVFVTKTRMLKRMRPEVFDDAESASDPRRMKL